MNPGELNKRIEIWGKSSFENELGENDYTDIKIATIWAGIIPQTGNMQRAQAETILTNVTTKITVRFSAGRGIKNDNWIMFAGKRFDIKYILDPYERHEKLEIFCTEVIV